MSEAIMAFKFGARSEKNLVGVHPDLISVMRLAISRSPVDFTVLEGLRTKERQMRLYRKGSSTTLNSRHLTGHAVDVAPLVNGAVSWDWNYYHQISPVIKQAAKDLGVSIEWGGDWKSFKDGPHWQLPWAVYSKTDNKPHAINLKAVKAPRGHAKDYSMFAWITGIMVWLSSFFDRSKQ